MTLNLKISHRELGSPYAAKIEAINNSRPPAHLATLQPGDETVVALWDNRELRISELAAETKPALAKGSKAQHAGRHVGTTPVTKAHAWVNKDGGTICQVCGVNRPDHD